MRPLPALAALALCACAAAPPPMNAPAELAAAESAFAAQSVREGMRAAFLANLGEDSVMFRPGPVDGRELFAKEPAEVPFVLDWRPVHVEVAASGELGLSTGPWTITSRADPKAPARHGQFVSIWKRPPAGPWKLVVDLGIRHPGADLADAPLAARTSPAAAATGGAPGLAAAEAAFDAASRARGTRAAYGEFAAADLRLYRDGAGPAIGRGAALAPGRLADEPLAWQVLRLECARSGELGYAVASYSRAGRIAGHALRVWRHEGGAWRIVLDVANPMPDA